MKSMSNQPFSDRPRIEIVPIIEPSIPPKKDVNAGEVLAFNSRVVLESELTTLKRSEAGDCCCWWRMSASKSGIEFV